MNIRVVIAATLFTALAGCATMAGPSEQPISVSTLANGAEVSGANCTMRNARGSWNVVSPGRVVISKSGAPLEVSCEKAGVGVGSATFNASKNALVGFALLTGGSTMGSVTGGATTAISDDSYLYPTTATVTLENK